jgi:hypothetical protein
LAGVSRNQSIAVVGCDPSSVSLAPFADATTGGDPHIFLGTSDATLLALLEFLVYLLAIMDGRITQLRRAGLDKLRPSPGLPTILLVLEEYAGLLAACDAYDAIRKPGERIKPLILGHIGRILREGAKVQILVWAIIQRPDAAIIGGADRAQFSRRITHRLDNADGVRMLNEDADPDTIQRLMQAKPGIGLLNEAGEPLRFFRSVLIDYPTYAAYVRANYQPKPLDPSDGF